MTKINFFIAFIACMIMIPSAVHSQRLRCDDKDLHWESGINAGLNNDGYEFDFKIIYFPTQYFGLKIGLGAAGEIRNIEDWDLWDDEYGYSRYDNDRDYTTRFKFNPGFVFRTGRIIKWKSQDGGFYLFTEPGIILSPGARGSRNAEYLSWDLKSGVNIQIDRFIFTLGYGISNFSLYSGNPDNYHGLPDKDNYITHSGFIGIACKF